MLGEVEHLLIELRGVDVVQRRSRIPHLVVVLQRMGEESVVDCADHEAADPSEENGLHHRGNLLLREPVADDREGRLRALLARRQVVGSIEEERVHVGAWNEGLEVQHLVALGYQIGDLVGLEDHRLSALGLVSPDLVLALDRLFRLGVDVDATDAMAGLAIDDVEGDPIGR